MKTIMTTTLATVLTLAIAPAFAQDTHAMGTRSKSGSSDARWDFERQRTDGNVSPFFEEGMKR